jgi:hypothetical protein
MDIVLRLINPRFGTNPWFHLLYFTKITLNCLGKFGCKPVLTNLIQCGYIQAYFGKKRRGRCQIGIPGCNNIFWRRAGWLPATIYSIYTRCRSNFTFPSLSIYCTRRVHLSFAWPAWPDTFHSIGTLRAHFTHEPRAVSRKLWESKRKCPKAVPRHLQNHVV